MALYIGDLKKLHNDFKIDINDILWSSLSLLDYPIFVLTRLEVFQHCLQCEDCHVLSLDSFHFFFFKLSTKKRQLPLTTSLQHTDAIQPSTTITTAVSTRPRCCFIFKDTPPRTCAGIYVPETLLFVYFKNENSRVPVRVTETGYITEALMNFLWPSHGHYHGYYSDLQKRTFCKR